MGYLGVNDCPLNIFEQYLVEGKSAKDEVYFYVFEKEADTIFLSFNQLCNL